MLIITPIPTTGYKAIWDTIYDRFLLDANGDAAWDTLDDIDLSHLSFFAAKALRERISDIW